MRPARPARCSADALLVATVVSLVIPERGSNRGSRARPLSITMRTPSTVNDVSAMSVESTTRRRPGGDGASARSCSARLSAPASGYTSMFGPSTWFNSCSVRRISPMPGKNTRMSPSPSPSPRSTAATTSGSMRCWPGRCGRLPRDGAERGSHCTSMGKVRPSLVITGASSNFVSPSVSGVADMAMMRSSGRNSVATSSVSARPTSVVRLRSWTSSKMTQPTPGSSGLFWSRRVNTPSVTTSIRVVAVISRSSRVW